MKKITMWSIKRKRPKREVIFIRAPRSVVAKVKERAKAAGVSTQDWCLQVLRQAMKE